jgi:stage V sporulation protein SpoVS
MLETSIKEGFYFMSIQVLKVSGNSNANAVAQAIIEYVLKDSIVNIDCIGIKASYTATKALIQVTEYLVKNCFKFNLRPYYIKVQVNGQDEEQNVKTAIRWTIIAKEK